MPKNNAIFSFLKIMIKNHYIIKYSKIKFGISKKNQLHLQAMSKKYCVAQNIVT
jgi:hypothetical protein